MDNDLVINRAVTEWHSSVNDADLERATEAVGDTVVVLGPRGPGAISADEFAGWIARSGIHLEPTRWHPISGELVVVEQFATWPESPQPTAVATVFRVGHGKVTAALRLPTVEAAIELAVICREMEATR